MDKTKKRWIIFALVNLGLLALVPLYRLYVMFVDLPIVELFSVCYMARVAHLYCPGCGGTRAISALLRLDIVRSFLLNPIIPITAAMLIAFDITAAVNIARGKSRVLNIRPWVWYAYIGLILLVFIVRNVLFVYFGIDTLGDIPPYHI